MIMFADPLIISVLKKSLNLLSVGLVLKMYAVDNLSEPHSLSLWLIRSGVEATNLFFDTFPDVLLLVI